MLQQQEDNYPHDEVEELTTSLIKLIGDTYGWLRVPHMDGFNTFAYEHPDGSIIESKDKAHKERIHLTAYEDAETGEKYVAATRR